MALTFQFVIQAWDQIQLWIYLKVTLHPFLEEGLDFLHYFWLWMVNKLPQIVLKVSGRNFQMKDLSAVTGASI